MQPQAGITDLCMSTQGLKLNCLTDASSLTSHNALIAAGQLQRLQTCASNCRNLQCPVYHPWLINSAHGVVEADVMGHPSLEALVKHGTSHRHVGRQHIPSTAKLESGPEDQP